jgi:chromosome segregation ATPase
MKKSASTQTAAATDARRSAASMMINRVERTLRQIQGEGADQSIAAIARRAHVSRTFLYQNSSARQLVADFMSDAEDNRHRADAERSKQIEASWRERALNAEDSLRSSHQEIVSQRNTIADLLGRIRDLESDLPADGAQRLISDNTTLKRRVRDLSQEASRLQERLQAARNNNHSLDSRIADLEAQLMD